MKIVIVKLSALGDILHSMVVLQYINEYIPDVKIDWVVEECYKDLFISNPHVNKVHTVNFKKIKNKKSFALLFRQLKRIRKFGTYDIVIDMQGLIKSGLVSFLIKSKLTCGFDKGSIREKISALFYNKKFNFPYERNIIERNISIISFALGININKNLINLKSPFLFPSNNTLFDCIDNIKKNILIIPGASYESKRYPVEKYIEIVSKIDANFITIWGNSEEKILVNKMKSISSKVHICEKLSLDKLISLISQVDLVIGSDSGPTHMAWALNVPSITLYGPTPGNRNSFSSKINRVIESESNVNPLNINKNDYSIRDIKISKIVLDSKELLS